MSDSGNQQPNPQPQFDAHASGAAAIAGLKELEKFWPVQCEIWNYQCRKIRVKYLQCRDLGFTDEQALQLCAIEWE